MAVLAVCSYIEALAWPGDLGDTLLNSVFVKAATLSASMDWLTDRRGNALAAGRGGGEGDVGEKRRED
jgi:hypothetical protein